MDEYTSGIYLEAIAKPPIMADTDLAERVASVETHIKYLAELEPRLRGYIRGIVDTLSNDIHENHQSLEDTVALLDKIVRGDHGNNGLVALVRQLERAEKIRNRIFYSMIGTVIAAIIALFSDVLVKFLS